ncbi:IS66 family transposase zinc-finger binding domain-containing protein [Paralcaligenes sp. KSB-10]|uniref:IS66 family transposase zinc-finger binding domain-containing protein n=1 Tax=Paralcaligenes sp. KSB-10 TaxID=2901142 RepID=UPI001E2D8E13|nr:IS66 family transposase zinc-finger binding domain-containing protein [Paralcaligenes sp. KSB-10]UHL66298.1 IS66 family transposase zinc-finger binding domain-containing protein [Paralcaligenes sp. KSB-10]
MLLDKLRRALFGQKSEKLAGQIDQLQLELEELHINQGERAQSIESAQAPASRPAPQRRPLPEHLPCEVHEHLPKESACPDCGGAWTRLGEDVSNVLEHVPASFRIVRHVRPRLACSCCERMAQTPAPTGSVMLAPGSRCT